jgi:hypothetical protein
MHRIKNILKYGYLFREYKDNMYFWEFYKILTRIGIKFIISYFNNNSKVKGMLVIVFLTIYYIYFKKNNPY